MSLMGNMRTGINSGGMQTILVLIVITFIFWGVGGDGDSNYVVAKVNGERITDTKLHAELRFVRATQGDTQSQDEFDQRQVLVLSQLMRKTLLLQEAKAQGITVSAREVNELTQQFPCPLVVSPVESLLGPNKPTQPCTPWFADDEGNYSQRLFESNIGRFGLDAKRWNARMADELMVNKLLELVGRTVQVTDNQVAERFRLENTSLDLEWIALTEEALLSTIPVASAEMESRLGEGAEELQAAYDAQLESRFTHSGEGNISIISMRITPGGEPEEALRAKLEEIRESLAGLEGEELVEAFAAAALVNSDDLSAGLGGDLGVRSEETITPEIWAAANEAGAGALTAVVRTSNDLRLGLVNSITEGYVTSFEQAREGIARELIQGETVVTYVADLANTLHEQWKSEEGLDMEALSALGLEVSSQFGVALSAPTLEGLDAGAELIVAAAGAENGAVIDEVITIDGGRLIGRLVTKVEADDTAFEQQRERLRMRIFNEEVNAAVYNWQANLQANASMESFLN